MTGAVSDDVDRDDLASVIGGRLRDHRRRRRLTLRDTAERVGISPGHLSDIEQANSHASLGVLVRLCRALQLPIAELLPRLGGPRVRQSSASDAREGVTRISHDGLELRVDRVVLRLGGSVHVDVDHRDDAFVFVTGGSCEVTIGTTAYVLDRHDSLDAERVDGVTVTTADGVSALVVRARRR